MKKIVALVLAMVMVLGLATTAFAAQLGADTLANAKKDAGFNYVVDVDDAEDVKDQTFATYEIEAIAKKDLGDVFPSWAAATLTDVEKDDDFDVEGSFVKVASEDYADLVMIDGNVITYFANAADYEDGYEGKAVKVTLPVLPIDDKDVKCNTLYAKAPQFATLYYYDYALYQSNAAGDVILNVDGVVVKAVKTDLTDGNDYGYLNSGHDYQVKYSDVKHTNGVDYVVTKVYCDDCGAEFKFVQGVEEAAIAVFGADNYMPVVVGQNVQARLWMELVVPAIPGVTGGSAVVTPDADNTVESPKTFDAGIAMYVGMSVMAAAGSAVVLKKKD